SKPINVVADRIVINNNEDSVSRFADSIQLAFDEGRGNCIIAVFKNDETVKKEFSNNFEADGIEFEEPTVNTFSFNNPVGACPRCEGYGKIIGIDEDLVIPNKSLSVYEDAIACWRGDKMQEWKNQLIYNAGKFNFPIHKPFYDLSDDQKLLLWTGNKYFKGLNRFFNYLEEKKYKIQYRVMLSRYRGKTTCPDCRGTRLKKEASYVKINNKSLQDLVLMPLDELYAFFKDLKLNNYEQEVSKRILVEIYSRLDFLLNVGLGYLTLNRLSSTLSGGESQRINLATSLGSSLVGSLYILDEPSIGLHSRDNYRLIKVLKQLQAIGNTVIVVEHDEDIIKSADEIIDIGPLAGRLGGEIIFQGNHAEIIKSKKSLTADYLTGKKFIDIPKQRRRWNNYIQITGARENNLKNIDVKFPLNVLTVISGVSGSGKSTLIKNILYPALSKIILGTGEKTGKFDKISGDIKQLNSIEFVDQNPIGRSSRSNPVTYLKAYDEIRKLFADQPASKINNFKPAHYSFNVDGGRCEECQGEGVIKVEMQFMADVTLICENCQGKRFKEEVLEVKYRDKNISDILDMTVNESIEFFSKEKGTTEKKIIDKLTPLADVGLGYIKLGQSSSTLSGGESQRVKLASFLSKENARQSTLFIFDEPTTGLHFHDINKLLDAFNALIERGNSILIIEHNMEIIKSADWVIDLGPEGGNYGGKVIFEGTPEELIKDKKSYTGKFLKEKIKTDTLRVSN
ncbi:MAG: excinuclease ABC subunit UvrA, partial [Bacteroidota bacterium]